MDQMLAARLHIPSRTLRIEEIRRPQPGPGQVLVKVEAAGVCLSDAHLIDGTLTPLLLDGDTVTLGHEVSGTIAETGAGVTAWSVGQRVVLYAGEVRDGATYTRGVDYDGGWAEYALSSATALTELPDSIPFEQGAIIPDAVSTPWGAITATGAVRPAEAVGVWGAGGLGVHAVQLLRAIGACPIIAVDPSGTARERALAAGADLALDPADSALRETVAAATGGTGLAAAFDFAGVPAVREQALTVLAPKGRLVLVGLTDRPLTVTDGTRFSYLQQQILGHYGSDMPVALPQLLRLVQSGRLDFAGSVSDVLPLARAAEAVDILNDRTTSPIRLVLRP
ncbi:MULTISPECIES: zinc-binding dehydrogenase [unclassified Streptomyces]|uniref:zinc-binding dehydrogenase n=1 Tax=unclassified Streptomyces TaxID=2593676 RepID=UPI0001C19448|nr:MULTISPECIES: zinc-binding dehydrogenase [unclassified Streptomyces]AEN08164.1 Alcohol dehydrogenase zinc-binding domain protein [Streptomyces sp. SirexAA-E]MYR68334.1 zinc-binding dehydrogenase [Streptomyces sp. SID4939]MYS02671.1 zinc-binding dehydrogenase [Streptomyces sp. SID4940]MYT66689.1 zinc-binding dehydrogenase [Streptomyces sp. SID8357]MYT83610.1 zinc-binding dehydrogenase [Streptomyces sp. SID8360]